MIADGREAHRNLLATGDGPLEAFEAELRANGLTSGDEDWITLKATCSEASFARRSPIFPVGVVPKQLLLVTEGIAAGSYLGDEGESFVYRFFEPGHFCTTITSAWNQLPIGDAIDAVTAVRGLLIPFDGWRRHYGRPGPLGDYFRQKLIETMLFDKEVILAKTFNRTESAYAFLETHQPDVIRKVPQRIIAQFLGMTPEGLSRFLRVRRAAR